MITSIIKTAEFFKKYIYTPLSLWIGIAILVFLHLKIDSDIKEIIPFIGLRIFIYITTLIFWYFAWKLVQHWFPSTKENKIGIVIALATENEKQKNRIKVDFAKRLDQTLYDNNLGSLFDILVLENIQAMRAGKILDAYSRGKTELRRNSEDAKKFKKTPKEFRYWQHLRKQTKGHIFIWGDIIERLDPENKYLMNIDIMVVHKHVDQKVSDRLTREIISIFPKEISFYEKLELKGFKFAADTIYLTTRYITGVAALISGDPITALTLHKGLKSQIDNFSKPLLPSYEDISKRITELVLAEKYIIATHKYHIQGDLTDVREDLDECINKSSNPYDALITRSYIAFDEDRDPVKALKLLNKAQKFSNYNFTWLYNKAFIFMYLEKWEKALICYRRLAKISYYNESDIVNQCIQFNDKLLSVESDKIQFYFVIAFLYLFKKNNYPLALEYFESFQKRAGIQEKFDYLLQNAKLYIAEINKQIGI